MITLLTPPAIGALSLCRCRPGGSGMGAGLVRAESPGAASGRMLFHLAAHFQARVRWDRGRDRAGGPARRPARPAVAAARTTLDRRPGRAARAPARRVGTAGGCPGLRARGMLDPDARAFYHVMVGLDGAP